MTDWREHFPDDSRVSWDRKVEREAGQAWDDGALFRSAWRYDSTSSDARAIETLFAPSDVRLAHLAGVLPLDAKEAAAVMEIVTATRRVLRRGGVEILRLYRGHPADQDWHRGIEVELKGRGLTAWSPLREVAVGHAARRRPGAVLVADVRVEQVAFAFDPASDGEIVVIGMVDGTVDTLIP